MDYSAIIPCGGIGSRLNLGYNKIIYRVNDKLLIEYTIKNFLLDEECKEVIDENAMPVEKCVTSELEKLIKDFIDLYVKEFNCDF